MFMRPGGSGDGLPFRVQLLVNLFVVTLACFIGTRYERWANPCSCANRQALVQGSPTCTQKLSTDAVTRSNAASQLAQTDAKAVAAAEAAAERAEAAAKRAAEAVAAVAVARQPGVELDARTQECMRLGEEYAAKLTGEPPEEENIFDAQFESQVTTAFPHTFLDMAQRAGTDKVTSHAYHYAYSRYLTHVRFADLHILEIGLGCGMHYGAGASLQLWRAFLPCSKISFVEYNSACALKHKDSIEEEAGGKLYIGSQDDGALLNEIVEDAKAFGGFDVIIDDGSHMPEQQMASIEGLWQAVKPGGIYSIEDLHDHWFQKQPMDGYETPAPELPIPLYQRLIHSINCHSGAFYAYNTTNRVWCRQEIEERSTFKDVVGIDCIPELCILLKGRQYHLPSPQADELAEMAKLNETELKKAAVVTETLINPRR